MFVKVQDNVLKRLVYSTTQRYSVYCQRGVEKPENIYIQETGIFYFLKKYSN